MSRGKFKKAVESDQPFRYRLQDTKNTEMLRWLGEIRCHPSAAQAIVEGTDKWVSFVGWSIQGSAEGNQMLREHYKNREKARKRDGLYLNSWTSEQEGTLITCCTKPGVGTLITLQSAKDGRFTSGASSNGKD